MNNSYKEKLKNLIGDSKLNANQKLLWELFLKISEPYEDEAVFEAASEDEANIELLTKHLRDKIWDMKSRHKKAWLALLQEEERFAELI